jgi:NitT/TauT family transport system ATP-binding protein
VKADIKIDLPYPRVLDLKKDPAYLEYRNQVWDLLREEVVKTQAELEAAG